MCNLCNTPKPPQRAARVVTRLKPGPLGDALAHECELNIAGATEVDGGGDAVTIESLHDYRLNSDYKSEVYFKGASALRIMFDPRWCVWHLLCCWRGMVVCVQTGGSHVTRTLVHTCSAFKNNAFLKFNTDPSCVVGLLRHMTSANPDITPFVVNSDRVHYHVRGTASSSCVGCASSQTNAASPPPPPPPTHTHTHIHTSVLLASWRSAGVGLPSRGVAHLEAAVAA